MQVQIQVLLAAQGAEAEAAIPRPNTGASIEVAKPQVFNRSSGRGFRVCNSMQTILKNENEGRYGRRTDIVNFVICVGRISRHLEIKYVRESRNIKFGI